MEHCLPKGRIAGIQFGELFTDGLYLRIGKPAMEAAEQIKAALKKYGYQLSLDTPTNQIFCIVSNDVMKEIAQDVEFGFWEKYDETHSVIRFATSWATTMEDTQKLIQILEKINKRKNQWSVDLGSIRAMVLPFSLLWVTFTWPLCCLAISLTRASPRPAPPMARLRDLSTR